MAKRWWALGVTAALIAAIWIPVGDALAPTVGGPGGDDTDQAAPAASAAPPAQGWFPREAQLAQRTLADPEISELSGLAASRLHPGVVFGINDSGGSATVYAIDASGATVARIALAGAKNRDWEAIAPAWDADGTPTLWIGDIGDNRDNQEHVRLLKIREPQELRDQSVEYEAFWVAYPDGPHNAEALMVHPQNGTISIATKSKSGNGMLYRLEGPLRSRGDNLMEPVMPVPSTITDGGWELSAAGEPRLVLTDYLQLHRWTGTAWVSALGPLQVQREALAWPWLPNREPNNAVLLGSEGVGSTIVAADVP